MAVGEPAVRIEPVRSDADVATWVETYNRASPCRPEGPVQTRHYWGLAPDWDAAIAWRGDRPVGVAHVELQHWVADSRRADIDVAVPLEERRRGVGTALYEHVSAWARARRLSGLEVWFDDGAADAHRYWAARGFVEVGRERLSELDLATARPVTATAPEGVELVTLRGREDLEPRMYAVGAEGIADIPGADAYDAGDFEHWRDAELRIPGLLPECSVVALAGDEVVGFATVVRFEARPEMAEHEMTTVAGEWRGRGIARAMKLRTIELARRHGLSALESANEARNAPILAVNRRLGYRHATDHVQLHGPLAP